MKTNRKLPDLVVPEQERQIEFYFEQIDAWVEGADDSENFDTNFVDSLKEQWEAKGHLSEKQIKALENIYESWVDV